MSHPQGSQKSLLLSANVSPGNPSSKSAAASLLPRHRSVAATSPLCNLDRLLRAYSWMGILPADVQGSERRVSGLKLNWWRYLSLASILIFLVLYSVVMMQVSTSPDCITYKSMHYNVTSLDNTIVRFDFSIYLLYVASTLFAHHACIPRYNKLIGLFNEDDGGGGRSAERVSLKGPLTHHFLILISSFAASALMAVGSTFALDVDHSCADVPFHIVYIASFALVINAVLGVPEIVYVAFVHHLTKMVEGSVRDFESSDRQHADLTKFCKRQKSHYKILRKVESVFRVVLFITFSFSIVVLTINAYFAFANAAGLVWPESAPAGYLMAAGQVLAVFIPTKRLVHITNHTHSLAGSLGRAVEALILHEPSSDLEAAEAEQVRMLLERNGGGISAMGFFSVNRGILLAVLGHLLTYMIIIIEFRTQQ